MALLLFVKVSENRTTAMIDLFAKQRQCLRIMGHNFVRDKSQLLRKWRNIKYFGVLLLVMSAQWPMMNYTIYHIDKMELVTACLSIIFTNILTVVKISTFLLYKWRFVALMQKLETMYNERECADCVCSRRRTLFHKINLK